MYGALWRALPGPWPVKLLIVLILVGAVLYGLFYFAFPWVATNFVPDDGVIDESQALLSALRA